MVAGRYAQERLAVGRKHHVEAVVAGHDRLAEVVGWLKGSGLRDDLHADRQRRARVGVGGGHADRALLRHRQVGRCARGLHHHRVRGSIAPLVGNQLNLLAVGDAHRVRAVGAGGGSGQIDGVVVGRLSVHPNAFSGRAIRVTHRAGDRPSRLVLGAGDRLSKAVDAGAPDVDAHRCSRLPASNSMALLVSGITPEISGSLTPKRLRARARHPSDPTRLRPHS